MVSTLSARAYEFSYEGYKFLLSFSAKESETGSPLKKIILRVIDCDTDIFESAKNRVVAEVSRYLGNGVKYSEPIEISLNSKIKRITVIARMDKIVVALMKAGILFESTSISKCVCVVPVRSHFIECSFYPADTESIARANIEFKVLEGRG